MRVISAGLSERVGKALKRLGEGGDLTEVLTEVIEAISEASGCESVGIRWRAGEDYPYYVTKGFGREFVVREGPLCQRDAAHTIIRHADGTPQLACLCGAVVSGKTDPRFPFFTEGGSFWTNAAQELRPELDGRQLGVKVRAYCMDVGYQVVAILPLRAGREILGTLQINCREVGKFTRAEIGEYEQIAQDVAEAVWERVEAGV